MLTVHQLNNNKHILGLNADLLKVKNKSSYTLEEIFSIEIHRVGNNGLQHQSLCCLESCGSMFFWTRTWFGQKEKVRLG